MIPKRTPVAALLFLTAAVLHSFGQQASTSVPGDDQSVQVSTDQIQRTILNFKESEFYGVDQAILTKRENELIDLNFNGIAINGPKKIKCKKRDMAPLIVGMRMNGERGWKIDVKKNCYIVATNLLTGEVSFAKAFGNLKRSKAAPEETSLKKPRPPGLPLVVSQVTEIDIHKQLPGFWNTGLWSLSVLYYDWMSNSIDIQLIGDTVIAGSPTQREIFPEPNLSDTAALPSYVALPKTPAPPDSGAAFTVEYTVKSVTPVLTVFGAFYQDIQNYNRTKNGMKHVYKNGMEKQIAAIIPATFIILTLDAKYPIQFKWNIPVYSSNINKNVQAKGFFTIETPVSQDQLLPAGQELICYIAMNGKVFGPRIIHSPANGG